MSYNTINISADEAVAFVGDLHIDTATPASRADQSYIASCISKLTDVLETCKSNNVRAVFFAGDIFNRIQATHEAVNAAGEIFTRYKQSGINLYTILGNHDIIRNSYENFQRSPLQTLFTFGVIEHINAAQGIEIVCEGKTMRVSAVDYYEYPTPAETEHGRFNVLLAHQFYDTSELIAERKHNILPEDVANWHYDMMYLGHDHEEYNTVIESDCYIFRTGSLMRATLHKYNHTRKPKFLIIKNLNRLTETPLSELSTLAPIKHRPFDEVISMVSTAKKAANDISSLKEVLSGLASKLAANTETDTDRIYTVLMSDPELPVECRNLILKYMEEN